MRPAIVLAALFILGAPALGLLFTLLACAGAEPWLGVLCGHNAFIPLFGFTLAVWLGLVGWIALPSARRGPASISGSGERS